MAPPLAVSTRRQNALLLAAASTGHVGLPLLGDRCFKVSPAFVVLLGEVLLAATVLLHRGEGGGGEEEDFAACGIAGRGKGVDVEGFVGVHPREELGKACVCV